MSKLKLPGFKYLKYSNILHLIDFYITASYDVLTYLIIFFKQKVRQSSNELNVDLCQVLSGEPTEVLANSHDPPRSPERMNKEQGRVPTKNPKKTPNPNQTSKKTPNNLNRDFAFHEKPPQQCCIIQQSTKLLFLVFEGALKTEQDLQNASGAHESSKILYRHRLIKNKLKAFLI